MLSTWLREHNKNHNKRPLLRTILMAHFQRYHLPMFLLKLFIVGTTFVRPWLLNRMLASIHESATVHAEQATWEPYVWALVLTLSSATQAVTVHFYFWQGVQNALAMRGALISLVQRKILRMHSSVKSEYSPGVLINLCSVDADNIMSFCWNSIHEIWASPLMIVVSLVWLYVLLGVPALVGCAVMLLSTAVSAGRNSAVFVTLMLYHYNVNNNIFVHVILPPLNITMSTFRMDLALESKDP